MTAPLRHRYAWLDLETTGLLGVKPGDLRTPGAAILEWALVLADDGEPSGSLDVVESYSGVIHYPESKLTMDQYVRRMHTENGLLAEVAQSTHTLAEADEFLAAIAAEKLADPDKPARSVVLAGNSVHFDAAWIRWYLPAFGELLSHRVFDVSTLLLFCDSFLPGFKRPEKRQAHRALDDVRESLAMAKYCREALGV